MRKITDHITNPVNDRIEISVMDPPGQPMTKADAKYYHDRCEQCERDWFERIETWRRGGHDLELDALYNVQPTLN